jgi:hypothetical protein
MIITPVMEDGNLLHPQRAELSHGHVGFVESLAHAIFAFLLDAAMGDGDEEVPF